MPFDVPHRGLLGDPGRPAGIALPPDRLPLVLGGRVRKRWRYVGAYGPGLSVCVGIVRIGLLTQSFWAVWDRAEGRLHERTRPRTGGVRLRPGLVRVRDGEVTIDLRIDEDAVDAVETVTPYGPAHAWTLKRAGVPVEGTVRIRERELPFDGLGVVDDSAGFPPRHTSWCWSAGVGTDTQGRSIGWNLVDGIHDDPAASERSVWVDGKATHAAPVTFGADLEGVRSAASADAPVGAHLGDGADVPAGRSGDGPDAPDGATASAAGGGRVDLTFRGESTRRRRDNLLLVRSSYEQPFGSFSGVLPGGIELADAHGVMERHDAVW